MGQFINTEPLSNKEILFSIVIISKTITLKGFFFFFFHFKPVKVDIWISG